jgi:hypothetical protein
MMVICNAWNHKIVEYYINMLISSEQRKVEIELDEILWTEKNYQCDQ